MITFLSIVLLVLAAFLVMIVLVQRGRGGGLAGAFGSGGGTTSAFGTKTGDVFTTVTVVVFVLFMLLSIWLSFQVKWKSTNTVVIPTAKKTTGGTTPTVPLESLLNTPATTPAAATQPVELSSPAATTSGPAASQLAPQTTPATSKP